MNHLRETFVKHLGEDVVLFTTDGYSDRMLTCGGIPSLYRTVDFGAGDPTVPFKQQRKFQPSGPLVSCDVFDNCCRGSMPLLLFMRCRTYTELGYFSNNYSFLG